MRKQRRDSPETPPDPFRTPPDWFSTPLDPRFVPANHPASQTNAAVRRQSAEVGSAGQDAGGGVRERRNNSPTAEVPVTDGHAKAAFAAEPIVPPEAFISGPTEPAVVLHDPAPTIVIGGVLRRRWMWLRRRRRDFAIVIAPAALLFCVLVFWRSCWRAPSARRAAPAGSSLVSSLRTGPGGRSSTSGQAWQNELTERARQDVTLGVQQEPALGAQLDAEQAAPLGAGQVAPLEAAQEGRERVPTIEVTPEPPNAPVVIDLDEESEPPVKHVAVQPGTQMPDRSAAEGSARSASARTVSGDGWPKSVERKHGSRAAGSPPGAETEGAVHRNAAMQRPEPPPSASPVDSRYGPNEL